ncbi:MAG: lytic transglycosylase domain-containing protein [Acidimicrobiales bacterium]
MTRTTRRRVAGIVALSIAAACTSSDAAPPAATTTSTATTAPSTTTSTAAPTTTTTEATTTTIPVAELIASLPTPSDSSELASALSEAELAIRDPALDDDTARAWGGRLQLLYRTLSANREWADEVVAAVDPAIADDVADNWLARTHLSSLVTSTSLSPTLPAWRIREPLPIDELLAAYDAAEAATGVPWSLLASVHLVETRMGRIEGLSTAGAVGPMQFLPSTWEACCEGDPTIDADAIMGAAVYLRASGAPDDLDRAIFAYNHSTDYVEAIKAYARVMERNRLAYRGYHAFEVYFLSAAGLVVLEPGYLEPEAVDAAEWIVAHPDALID